MCLGQNGMQVSSLIQDICKIEVLFSLLFFKISFNIRYYDWPKPPKAWLFTSATDLCRFYAFVASRLYYCSTQGQRSYSYGNQCLVGN